MMASRGLERLVAALLDSSTSADPRGLCCWPRPREFLALRWRDVDLDADVQSVTQNVDGKDVCVPGSVGVGEAG
jgi:hypothetical protein